MSPHVPVEGILVIHWKPTVGTHEGFSCVHLADMCITTMSRGCDFVTPRAPILVFPTHFHKYRIFPTFPLFLHWGWSGCHCSNVHLCCWWWCCHCPNVPQELWQVPCPGLIHCLLEKSPSFHNHFIPCGYSTDSWNVCKINHFDPFDFNTPYIYIKQIFFTSFNPFDSPVSIYLFTSLPWSTILCISLSSSVSSSSSSSCPAFSSSTTSNPTCLSKTNHDPFFSSCCSNG